MTRLWNDPADFADEMIDGFVAANGRSVRRVPGGVVRSTVVPDGQVAVVIGGGSGHYPAFGGLVGPGLAHGAAMGNLFASPSTQQIVSVAKAAQHGGGVFFSYGNYAGDVLNFDAAQDRLRADGIACETVTVTDDIFSAAPHEKHKRRGIAGDLTVFRIAAAAAEAGADLAEVTRVAQLANERTRSFGVAFTGCTLPGAEAAAVHACPRAAWRSASASTANRASTRPTSRPPTASPNCSSSRLLDELPDGIDTAQGARVVPILNGLGSLKYEEMFVVYRRIAQLLAEAGAVIVDPHVGEYCTSFDMAGISLTLFWLGASTTSSSRSGTPPSTPPPTAAARWRRVAHDTSSIDAARTDAATAAAVPPASDASRAAAGLAARVVAATADIIDEHVDELGRLDPIAGDGDHGIGMQRGARAAREAAAGAAAQGAGAGTVLIHARQTPGRIAPAAPPAHCGASSSARSARRSATRTRRARHPSPPASPPPPRA